MNVRTLVVCADSRARCRAPRTLRALAEKEIEAEVLEPGVLRETLACALGAVWLLEAGAWLRGEEVAMPRGSATGRALCALGAVYEADGEVDPAWRELLQRSGGHLDEHVPDLRVRFSSVYLEKALAIKLGEFLGRGTLTEGLRRALAEARVVHWAALDVVQDDRLRVAQVVTSLQIGGAERMVLDLSHYLPRCGVNAALIVTGRATRKAFLAPSKTVDVSAADGGRAGRMAAAAKAARDFHADVVHAHLLHPLDLARFRATGIPLALTIHNARQGWQAGTESLGPADADLLVACSRAVEKELVEAGIAIPVRTAWNGIDAGPYAASPGLTDEAREIRQRLGIAADDVVLLALANPRPQKRLERLPRVLARVRTAMPHKRVVLVIAGEPSAASPGAAEALERIEAEIRWLALEQCVLMPGAVEDVAALLHASNVLVSMSAWEGLSLAHLEALAAGKPVVATAAGGTAELAAYHANLRLLDLDCTDEQAASAIVSALTDPPAAEELHPHFHAWHMARRYAALYPRIAARQLERKPEGLLLVTNNFSTGGAQSSARRLLAALKKRGHRVRAAVIQEQREFPTPGRQALETAGVPVFAASPPEEADALQAVEELLAEIDRDPPQTVVFWNAITRHKMLLADLLADPRIRIVDVSPGEMYFSSLVQYFERPQPGFPLMTAPEYGAKLSAVVVKYERERERAEQALGTRVEVIRNGIEATETCPERAEHAGDLVLGTAARLSPQKKLEQLFDAVKLARPHMGAFRLLVAGGADGDSGPAYVTELKERYCDLPIEWLGEVDTPEFLRQLDLFVMISEPAGCPNASLEAMAEGLPVLATDVGGAHEQVVDGVTGRLVPGRDIAALAAAMVDAVSDRARLRTWGNNGWEHVRREFPMERMVDSYEGVFALSRSMTNFENDQRSSFPMTHV